MQSCDTNILLYYLDNTCSVHQRAKSYIESVWNDQSFLICDLVLMELYVLLRNPKVLKQTLSATEAAGYCRQLRSNSSWQVVESSQGIMSEFWVNYANKIKSPWAAYDIRLGLTLKKSGVTTFATRNIKDFKVIGFEKLINPVD